ncbi:hypothetical protein QNH20_19320 [Neobacillus sp. WH10]|uniref:hypothetical protein n=1 Tax=Neobacillus sp. WH10 TaxID=3047873 RepID=UPI0024C1CB18|nr:hypothetical protein [Neobacillus sp. WH10]WHY76256.1 hypothetical protein QNH20_19320 [Neobacillus sp. WH10]
MSKKEFRTMPLYQLHKLCQNEDPNALSEWKRRWESDYPKIAEVSKGQGKLIIHYTDK